MSIRSALPRFTLTTRVTAPSLMAAALLLGAHQVHAEDALPPVSIGAGVRTSFVAATPEGGDTTSSIALESARLYISGPVTKQIKFMFNTEYSGSTNEVGVMDVAATIAVNKQVNIWMGRFLPPSDRANLYGPYYAHHWSVYTDGVQDGYPFIFQGRANGAMYWGQFGKVKASGGVFDGKTLTGSTTLLTAGRVQVDFWDPEDGYYLNGTYYGDKNLLAIGAAAQMQGSDKKAYNVDFLMERKSGVSVEAEWAKYDQLGGYSSRYGTDQGGYVLASYLFPKPAGVGKFEVLGKFAKAQFRKGITPKDADFDQKTTEFNLNYVIKQFNARVMMFYKDTRFDAVRVNDKQFGVGLQLQM